MYSDDHRSSIASDGDTTQGSMHFQNESSQQINRLEDGTLEITDTLPKKEYYMSLRKGDTRMGGSMSRIGGSTAGLGTMSGTIRPGFFGQKSQSILEFKPSGKNIEVLVIMLDGKEETFQIDRKAYGQHLFDMVCDHLDLNEREYFGITYQDKDKITFWLDFSKRLLKQSKDKLIFEFQVKYYPPNLDTIVEDLTRYYFCLQIRQDLVSGQLPCSFYVYVLLASYSLQSEAGDYDPQSHRGIEYVRNQPFAPQQFQTDEMLYQIVQFHKHHRGQTPEEADRNFLENARKLALYGVDRHKVKNSDGVEEMIGVYHGGILIYHNRIRVIRFSWARVIQVKYERNKIILLIRELNKNDARKQLIYKCRDVKMAKRLYHIIVDHHYFFRMIEFGVPKKPNLQPGFVTRKYHKNPECPSPNTSQRDLSGGNYNSASLKSNSNRQPRINRLPPKQRREQSEDGWFTLPTKDGSFNKGNIITSSPKRPVVPNDRRGSSSQNQYFPTTPNETVNDATQTMSPKLSTGLDGIGPRPQLPPLHWRMSPADCTLSIGMDERGLDIASQPGAEWQGCRGNKGVKSNGEYFYEARILEPGEIRIGWSTNDANLELGTDKNGYGFGQAGSIHDNEVDSKYGLSKLTDGVNVGDYVGCRIDFEKGQIAYYVNGRVLGPIKEIIPDQMRREPFFPTLTVKDGRAEMNFGEFAAFVFPPSDSDTWTPICRADDTCQAPNKHEGWRMNAYDASKGMDVAPAGLAAQSHLNEGWQGVRANRGVRGGRGKYYYETTTQEDGLARVGWSTEATTKLTDLGGDDGGQGFGYGADPEGFGLSGNQGKKMFRNDIENYGRSFKKGDTIGCMLDLDEGTVRWSLNGEVFAKAYDIPLELRNGPSGFFPHVCMKDNTLSFNFGEKVFKHYPGNEWTPLTYTPEQFMKTSRKKGPERKVRGWSYLSPEDMDIHNNVKQPNTNGDTSKQPQSPNSHYKPNNTNLAIIVDETHGEEEGSYQPRVVSKSGTRTVTNGEVKEVKMNEPNVETEEYIDEFGNKVRKTITKTKKITKIINTVSDISTERSENDVMSKTSGRITKVSKQEDDYDDQILQNAILAVTFLDGDASVLNDYVGSLEFSANSGNTSNGRSTRDIVESEI